MTGKKPGSHTNWAEFDAHVITPEEYEAALTAFDAAGLEQGWLQEHEECE